MGLAFAYARLLPLGRLLPLALLAACSAEDATGSPPVEQPLPGPSEWNRAVVPPTDGAASEQRASCAYERGALPAETQGESRPYGKQIPIDHIVVAMMENRSFDHYFQKIRDIGIDADVAPDDYQNLDPNGQAIKPFPIDNHCFVDTSHSWSRIRQQVAGGSMNGFVMANEGETEIPVGGDPEMLLGRRALAYYTEKDLPLAYFLAKEFAIGDRYFASSPTATWPNRMFMQAANSFGNISNDFPKDVDFTLLDYLTLRGVSWRWYYSSTPTYAMFLDQFFKYRNEENRFVPMSQFAEDAAAGLLPSVSFIDPDGTSSRQSDHTDEHPPSPTTQGQHWLANALRALAASAHWSRSAFFINYDEHGGLYDHVPPPKACIPDDRELSDDQRTVLSSYGVRVPFFVISPFAKKGYVTHDVYDHTSVLRFIAARFQLPALSRRDANALAPWDAFDFANPPHLTPPAIPDVPLDQAIVDDCRSVWGE